MTGLQRRVERLEGRDGSAACPECGAVPGGPMRFVVEETPPEATIDTPQPTQYCPGCGRVLTFTITFDRTERLPT